MADHKINAQCRVPHSLTRLSPTPRLYGYLLGMLQHPFGFLKRRRASAKGNKLYLATFVGTIINFNMYGTLIH